VFHHKTKGHPVGCPFSLRLVSFQPDRHRPVIVNFYVHTRAKHACLNREALGAKKISEALH